MLLLLVLSLFCVRLKIKIANNQLKNNLHDWHWSNQPPRKWHSSVAFLFRIHTQSSLFTTIAMTTTGTSQQHCSTIQPTKDMSALFLLKTGNLGIVDIVVKLPGFSCCEKIYIVLNINMFLFVSLYSIFDLWSEILNMRWKCSQFESNLTLV
jgi:hypothetical protein